MLTYRVCRSVCVAILTTLSLFSIILLSVLQSHAIVPTSYSLLVVILLRGVDVDIDIIMRRCCIRNDQLGEATESIVGDMYRESSLECSRERAV